MRRTLAIAICALGALGRPTGGQAPDPGLVGREAPPWRVAEWINLPEGTAPIEPGDLRGRVVYLYFFQSWCPGCHARGFPTLTRLIERYDGADDVNFIAVQTVFEGYGTNTPARAAETAKRYRLTIPVGHDGEAGAPSPLLRRYRGGGTPWVVIIDKRGTVRFNGFHLDDEPAAALIERLRREVEIETLPGRRGGQDRLGAKLPALRFDGSIPAADEAPPKPRPTRATLYRWWTDTCPYCEASLPAIETLRKRYGPRGLDVVAAYHPKARPDADPKRIETVARAFGYRGLIAIDQDWSELKRAYLDHGRRRPATSVTLLVDRDGVIRFVQPGPVFFPSPEARHAQENADYHLLERAIRALVAE